MKKIFPLILIVLLFGCNEEEIQTSINEEQINILSYFSDKIEYIGFTSSDFINNSDEIFSGNNRLFGSNKYYKYLIENFNEIEYTKIYSGLSSNQKNNLMIVVFNNKNDLLLSLKKIKNLKLESKGLYFNDKLKIYLKVDNNKLLIFHDKTVLKPKKKITENIDFIKSIKNIDNKESYWGILKKGKLLNEILKTKFEFSVLNGKIPFKNEVRFLTFSLEKNNTVNLTAKIIFETETTAAKVASGLKIGISFNLFSNGKSEVNNLAKKLKVKRISDIVILNIELNKNDISVINNSQYKTILL